MCVKGMVISLISIFLLVNFAHAQVKITGKVTDAETGNPVAGATILLKDNGDKGVVTDVDGIFFLAVQKNTTHTLLVSNVGYKTKEITDVYVAEQAPTPIAIGLEKMAQELEGVVVKSTSAKNETAASLYRAQKMSATVSDGISADIIRRTPDKNTGDVLKRVSGTTIQDNKFVIIRGLSDRYNTALLDGGPLPSTEPNRKAFSFDIVPSNLVDNIVISKTATPDLPGDFTGGAVQVTTKDIPLKNFLTLSLSEGYNTASTFKDFASGPRNTTDYFGFDNGNKQLSGGFPSTATIVNKQLTSEQNINALQSLPKDWGTFTNKALPIQAYQLSGGKAWLLKNNNKFGTTIAISYRNGQNIIKDVLRDYYEYNYVDNIYKFSTSIGALANFAYTTKRSKITFKNIYNRIYDDQYLSRTGHNNATSSDVRFFAFDLIQKSLLKSTLDGTHQIGSNAGKLTWNLSYAKIINDQPDQRKVSYIKGDGQENYAASITTLGKENTRMYTYLNENNYSGGAAYGLPLNMFGNTATFKGGVSSLYRQRDFDARFLGMVLNVNAENANEIRERSLNKLFAADVLANYTLDEIPNDLDAYKAHSTTNAGFLMLDNRIGRKSRVVWGARVEQFDLELTSKVKTSMIQPVNQNYMDVLPSVNYTYSLTPKINLRASYFRSLARPEFRELAPTTFYDYEILANLVGNPNLKKAQVDNGDIRVEYYPSAGEIISVSAFYKKFKNAIEAFNNDANSTREINFMNSNKANNYGFELEIRKSLDFIAENEFLQKTTFYTNFSWVKSQVQISDPGLALLETKRVMVGQAPYVINSGLQHSFLNEKLNFNAVYNRVGRRLSIAPGRLFYGVWEAPRDLVDLQLSLKVFNSKGEFKLNAGDVLNQRIAFYFDNNKNSKYDIDADEETASYKPGSTFSIAFSYTL